MLFETHFFTLLAADRAADDAEAEKSQKLKIIIIVAVVAVCLVLIIIVIACCVQRRRQKPHHVTNEKKNGMKLTKQDIHQSFRRCLLYTSPSPRDGLLSRMPSSA